jgi:hypothetical protein
MPDSINVSASKTTNDLLVTANQHINGSRGGSTQFQCGTSQIWVDRTGRVDSITIGPGGKAGYEELLALVNGIIQMTTGEFDFDREADEDDNN